MIILYTVILILVLIYISIIIYQVSRDVINPYNIYKVYYHPGNGYYYVRRIKSKLFPIYITYKNTIFDYKNDEDIVVPKYFKTLKDAQMDMSQAYILNKEDTERKRLKHKCVFEQK